MFVTPLKLYRLPAALAKAANHEVMVHDDVYEVRELIACLNGEGSDRNAVHQMTRTGEYRFEVTISDDTSEVTIRTKDGTELCYSRPSLVRRFHFFDDFLSAFPDADEVEVPFYSMEVMGCLYLDETEESVADCLECMRYFNPKKADEYFQLKNLGEVSDKDLLELVADLTEEEVTEMMEARQFDTRPPLPRCGRDRPALACILEAFVDVERLKRMFSDYPSYLFCILSESNIHSCPKRLLAEDFSRSNERNPSLVDMVLSYILDALSFISNKEEAVHLLTMLGVRHERFANEKKVVVAPYCSKFDSKKVELGLVRHCAASGRLCRLLEMSDLALLSAMREALSL